MEAANQTNITLAINPGTGTAYGDYPWHIAFSILGLTAILINVFILIVLLSDKSLLKQSAFIFAVTCSHLLCGLGIGSMGTFRLVNRSNISKAVSAWTCVTMAFPLLLPLAFESLSVMLCTVGVERLLAAVAPNWFRVYWTAKRAWLTVLAVYLVSLSAICYGAGQAWMSPGLAASLACGFPSVVGNGLVQWNFGSTVVGGTIAVTLTLISYRSCMTRIAKMSWLSGEIGVAKRQLALTTSMLTVTSLDFILIVIPFTLNFSNSMLLFIKANNTVSNVANSAYCLNACLNIVPHMAFNSAFRKCACKLIRLSSSKILVVPPVPAALSKAQVGGNHHRSAKKAFEEDSRV